MRVVCGGSLGDGVYLFFELGTFLLEGQWCAKALVIGPRGGFSLYFFSLLLFVGLNRVVSIVLLL
jgi:hypothetical protein